MKLPLYTRDITKILTAASGTTEQILTLDAVTPEKYNFDIAKAEANRSVNNLFLECQLYSLPQTNWPEELTTQILNEYEKNLILRNNEWKSPNRFHLEMLARDSPSDGWQSRGLISIVNRGSIPYIHPGFVRGFKAENGVLYLSNTGQLAVRMINVGGGILTGNDKLIITATYRESPEVSELSAVVGLVLNLSFLVDDIGEKLFTIGSDVAFFDIHNNGNARIWLNFQTLQGIGTGKPIQPGGHFFWTNDPSGDFRFLGDIYAISETLQNVPLSAVVAYRNA